MTPRAKFVIGVVAVVAALVGVRACAAWSATSRDAPSVTVATGARPGEPDITTGPAGTIRESAEASGEQAARNAAVAAVGATGDVAAAGFITRADMIREFTTERFAPALIDESSAQLDAMTVELTEAGVPVGAVRFSELPLTANVVELDGAAATVDVWSVTVVTVGDDVAPRQVWRTVTVTLARQDGTWLVDGWAAEPGPTPALATDSEIATVADVHRVLAQPVMGGR